MKKHSLFLAAVLLSALPPFSLSALQSAAESGGLELGLQAYTFRQVTLAETLDRAVAMKIKNIQAYGGQKVSAKVAENFSHNMSDAAKAEVRALFKARGLNLTSYGVVTGKDEADWRKIFAFAKEMGLRDIATEPKADVMPLIARLADETGVKVALHNHPRPSIYFDPDFALATVKPYGSNIGLCADTGHWARSGFDPVATLRKVEGRIVSLHFKDLSEIGLKAAHDMPWGTGASEAAKQILELRRQGFKGIAYMEYEYKVPLAQLDIETAECADWFPRAVAASEADLIAGRVLPSGYVSEQNTSQEWAGKRGSKSDRWDAPRPLFAQNLANADLKTGAWEYKDGVLLSKGNGNIWTKETHGDFALNLDFRCEEKTDSGVILRCSDTADWVQNSLEVQIIQEERPNDKHNTGGIYDISAPSRAPEIEPGKWYHMTVIAQGTKLQVILNGERLTNIDLAKWNQAGQNPDGTKNKFKKAMAGMSREGRIGLQGRKTISFRNIVIERIAP
ncbi:MAG: DUF1080 domain-containing protein [Opitutaceae bacterium]|jgi:sugar phosphate isomerase/epimerase|nr:DUF1080 domain-containing protein [Opitutaceae bacterium]